MDCVCEPPADGHCPTDVQGFSQAGRLHSRALGPPPLVFSVPLRRVGEPESDPVGPLGLILDADRLGDRHVLAQVVGREGVAA